MAATAVMETNEHPAETAPTSRGWRLAPKSNREARSAENRGRLWLVLSYVLCPCHLPVTMALLVTLAGGTAVGAAMTESMWRLGAVMAGLYGLALWRGFHHLRRAKAAVQPDRACSTRWCDI